MSINPANELSKTKIESTKQSGRPVCIVVLGMHRSGTSVLTGVFGLLGASLPKKMLPPNVSNPKGFFEPNDIVDLHDELLSTLGSFWADFRPLDPALFNSVAATPFKARLVAALRAEYGDTASFVVKDPRICRLLPLWRDVVNAFGAEIRAVLVIRNPLEVARSLMHRDGLSREYCLNLWLRYALDAEFESRHGSRVFVNYSDLIRDWMQVIEKSERGIGVVLSDRTPKVRAAIEALIDPNMRHYNADDEIFALGFGNNPLVLKAYRALEMLVERSDDAEAMKALDEVRQQFDETIRTIDNDTNLASVLSKLHSAQGQISHLEVQASMVVPLRNELGSAQARADKLEATLAERAEEITQLKARLLTVQEKSLNEITALEYRQKVEHERQKNKQRQLEQQVTTLATEAAKAASELSLIKRSLSWRIGKPLRLFAVKFPRVLRIIKRIIGL